MFFQPNSKSQPFVGGRVFVVRKAYTQSQIIFRKNNHYGYGFYGYRGYVSNGLAADLESVGERVYLLWMHKVNIYDSPQTC